MEGLRGSELLQCGVRSDKCVLASIQITEPKGVAIEYR